MKKDIPKSKIISINPEFEAAVKERERRNEAIHKMIHNALENIQESHMYGVNKQQLLLAHNDLLKKL